MVDWLAFGAIFDTLIALTLLNKLFKTAINQLPDHNPFNPFSLPKCNDWIQIEDLFSQYALRN